MLRLYWPEASALLPRFLKEVNEAGNLNIDNDFVIRCMFSVAGIGTRLDFDLRDPVSRRFRPDRLLARSSRLLGGISTMVPFVHYLYHAPQNVFPKGSKADARRALFLFAFSKVFTQYTESRTGAFIRDHLPASTDIAKGEGFPFGGAIEYVYWHTNLSAPDERLFGRNVELADIAP
jgi:hypothetical protein